MARALVIGASGQLGRHAVLALRTRGWDVAGTYASRELPGLRPLDVLDRDAVRACVATVAPEVCVVCAAMTNVERCEDEPDRAAAMNARAPAVIAAECREAGARVVHLSTDYVYDGVAGPYREEDATGPLSVYGRTKLEGEHAVLATDPRNVSVRTTVVFSHDPAGLNFVMQLRARLQAGQRMRVPVDQVSTPTYAPDVAAVVAELCARAGGLSLPGVRAPQILNVVGPEVLDRHAFAVRAAHVLGLPGELLDPVPTSALAQKAPRPLQAGLRTERLRALGFSMRGVDEALADLARRVEAASAGSAQRAGLSSSVESRSTRAGGRSSVPQE
jgi:dTDP-4-dehydrorhamnose reductase